MKKVVMGLAVVAAALIVSSCFLDGLSAPELVVTGPTAWGGAAEPLEGGESINFYTVGPNGVNRDIVFTIQNAGNDTLRLIDTAGDYVAIESDNSGGLFTIVQPTSDTLDPGDSFSFTIRFTSDGTDNPYAASIEIRSDDPENPSFELNLVAESSST